MPRMRDLLQRFRRAGTPGAPARPGVPADRVSELAAELEPVLVMLATTSEAAARIRAEGRREAERRRQEATTRAQSTIASAVSLADADRTHAALRVGRVASAESAATLSSAEEAARDLRRRAAEELPNLVDRVVATVRARLEMTSP